MKPVRIEFVRAPRWLTVWVPASLAIGVLFGTLAAMDQSLRRSGQQVRDDAVRVRAQIASLQEAEKQAAALRTTDPRQAQLLGVQQQLRLDWNPAFATVENMDQPGAKLVHFSINAASKTTRVEYEVESVVQASAMTVAMNAGTSTSPWRLERVTTGGSAAIAGDRMRATWSAHLGALR